jgi:hypothetical protein
MIVSNASDRELINELNSRGYKVAKADRIRTASVIKSVNISNLVALSKEKGWIDNVRYDLGSMLGRFLMERGAIGIIEEISASNYCKDFRASATIIVEDPRFDWPYELKMEK